MNLGALSLLYAVGLLGWDLLRTTSLSAWWPFELVDVFGAWFYLPLPLLALLAALGRRRRAGAWLILPLLLFGVEYGPLFWPRGAPEAGASVRVMTANLSSGNRDAGSLITVLREQRPDVVAVQELSGPLARSLPARLAQEYPYQHLFPSQQALGMGVLSRYPIVDAAPPKMVNQACFCQQLTVELPGRAVTVLNVHPPVPDIAYAPLARRALPTDFEAPAQEPSLRAILERVETIEAPLIVLGDLNTADRQPAYRWFSGRLRDAYREAGWGFGYTYPSEASISRLTLRLPLARIDYIFHDETWSARSAWTADLPGSDHRVVVADLAPREPSPAPAAAGPAG